MVLLALAVWLPVSASACAVCYGEPDSPAARGLSWAIAALGVMVMSVLAGAVAFFVQAGRKAARLQATDSTAAANERTET